jgi:subtilisin family serine protease
MNADGTPAADALHLEGLPHLESPEPSGEQGRLRLRRSVQRQAQELAERSREPSFRRQLIAALQRRRAGTGGLLRIDALKHRSGFETLLVAGEILIAGESYERPGAREFAASLGLTERELGCAELAGRVVRLVNPGCDARSLDDAARLLRSRGFVASVNHIAPLAPVGKGLGGPEPAWGPGDFADYPKGPQGPDVRIAVIDTGIAEQKRTDNWLGDVRRSGNIDPLDTLPNGPDGLLDFAAGHGTFVAGVAQQVAPRAMIEVYRALDSDGVGSELEVACAMIRAVRGGADLINLSLGCRTVDDLPSVPIGAALEVIGEIESREQREVVIVAAAGNDAGTRPCWPAAFRRVVAVAAVDADLRPASWSSRGWWVDLATVGQGIRSTYVQGQESYDLDPEPDTFGPDAWVAWSGTSFAAPQITGAIARLMQFHSGMSPRQALVALHAAGRPRPDFGRVLRLLPGL